MKPARTAIARTAVALAVAGLTAVTLAACSGGSSTSGDTNTAASASPVASSSVDPNAPSADILATCDQIVADKMPQADAEALATSKGYITRIGSVDGEMKPLTMDYRMERMTFDIENGIVTKCLVG